MSDNSEEQRQTYSDLIMNIRSKLYEAAMRDGGPSRSDQWMFYGLDQAAALLTQPYVPELTDVEARLVGHKIRQVSHLSFDLARGRAAEEWIRSILYERSEKDADWNLRGKTYDEVKIALLMDLRDELQRLNNLLHCNNFTSIPTTLRTIRLYTGRTSRSTNK